MPSYNALISSQTWLGSLLVMRKMSEDKQLSPLRGESCVIVRALLWDQDVMYSLRALTHASCCITCLQSAVLGLSFVCHKLMHTWSETRRASAAHQVVKHKHHKSTVQPQICSFEHSTALAQARCVDLSLNTY